ncbi:MAG TPA: FxsA family protein [Micromonosporaceae bacterium]
MSAAGSSGIRQTGKRFSPVGFGFVLSLAIEVLAFIGVGHLIGYGWAFLLLVVLSMAGLALFVRQTPRAWRDLRNVAAAGERPGPQLTRHLAGLAAAVLIAVPGFVSALAGVLLFLPPVRKVAGRAVTGFATRRISSSMASDLFGPRRVRVKVGNPAPSSDPTTPIEGEIVP